MKWVEARDKMTGILTPDQNGLRMLYNISEKRYYPLQVNGDTAGVAIGRFVFDPEGFQKARHALTDALTQEVEWLVVDEIGRLEMDRGSGLEPAVSKVIEHFKTNPARGNLLLVIRDYLLNDAISHYGLQEAIVLDAAFFNPEHHPSGLVLCGGKSVRMGRDKAWITYHKEPQYAHVAGMMSPFCKNVFISCNAAQKALITQLHQAIEDSATFADAGPLTGVLSAFEQLPGSSLLVLGCDYPYFTTPDMLALLRAREPGVDVVCYYNKLSGFDEPLLAVYEKRCAELLFRYYGEGHTSLRHFLNTVNTKTIPTVSNNIQSVDEPVG